MIRDAKMKKFASSVVDGDAASVQGTEFENFFDEEFLTPEDKVLTAEIEEALTEQDVFHLRNQIRSLLSNGNTSSDLPTARFNLADETDLTGLPDQLMVDHDFFGDFETLPKIHLNNHHRNGQENLHQLYRNASEQRDSHKMEGDLDESWNEIETALMEKDIMELRATLTQIGKMQYSSPYSLADLDAYLEGDLSIDMLEEIDAEIAVNHQLASEVRLMSEMDDAIGESDILLLREQLQQISMREASTPFTVGEIENYLEDAFGPEERSLFEEELLANRDLRAEINLLSELEEAFSESDVSGLRQKLRALNNDITVVEEKSIVPDKVHLSGLRRLKTVAAVFVLVLGISVVVRFAVSPGSDTDRLLAETPGAITSFRSVMPDINTQLSTGFEQYNNADFSGALHTFQKVLAQDGQNAAARFYTGASHQNLENFDQAIQAYNQVLTHNDNIFVEQAEWYMGLCLVQLGDYEKAGLIFEAIISRNGYYTEKAARALKRIS